MFFVKAAAAAGAVALAALELDAARRGILREGTAVLRAERRSIVNVFNGEFGAHACEREREKERRKEKKKVE